MLEWILRSPEWVQSIWFVYVTFHDLLQWALVALLGMTAWGQRKHRAELQQLLLELQHELIHVHDEVHTHIDEDRELHLALGQDGISRGK